jgi:hypothetical protein
MAFDVQPITSDIADGILAWCGVTSPTPAEASVAQMAADAAVDTINFYRQVDDFEPEYTSLAIEMGVYLWQKRGVDGTVSFGENGVQRSFEAGSFPRSMLSRIKLPVVTG